MKTPARKGALGVAAVVAAVVVAGAVAGIAAGALALTFFLLRSDSTRPASSAPARPTSSIGQPADTVEEALSQVRRAFTSAPSYVVHDIESVVYVDTTVGRARDLFDPSRTTKTWDTPDELPAWAWVDDGTFPK